MQLSMKWYYRTSTIIRGTIAFGSITEPARVANHSHLQLALGCGGLAYATIGWNPDFAMFLLFVSNDLANESVVCHY